jgi:hypothetical protein
MLLLLLLLLLLEGEQEGVPPSLEELASPRPTPLG